MSVSSPSNLGLVVPGPGRSDAIRNRQRILESAMKALSDIGVDAQMTDIAEAAGLGVGTLYRNFPSKEALVNELVHDHLSRCLHFVEKAARNPDAWEALIGLMRGITEQQKQNRVLSEFMGGRIAGTDELVELRRRVFEVMETVVRRAKRSGQLRSDVGSSDVRMVMIAMARVSSSESPVAHRLALRFLSIVLDGLRAPGHTKLVGRAPTIAESDEAVWLTYSDRQNMPDRLKRGRRPWPT